MFYQNPYGTDYLSQRFQNKFSFKQRLEESSRIINRYPDRIPVICEKSIGKDTPDIDKHKYLVPMDLTIGNFIYVIRKRIKKLQPYDALFLIVNDSIPSNSMCFSELYYRYKDSDGFLYITYTKENTFG